MSKQVSRKFLIRFTLGLGFIAGCMLGVGATGFIFLQREPPEVVYERGCSDMIEAYYRNKPYFKAILDSRMYEDTILMGWVVRQFIDPHLSDPELSIEGDTIAIHAYDSLGYCVLTGVHRYADSTDTMPAVEADDDVDWDTIPFNEVLTESMFKAKMESLGWLDEDTMPAVDLRLHPKAVKVPHQYPGYPTPAVERDTLPTYKRWHWYSAPIILPDTGGD